MFAFSFFLFLPFSLYLWLSNLLTGLNPSSYNDGLFKKYNRPFFDENYWLGEINAHFERPGFGCVNSKSADSFFN